MIDTIALLIPAQSFEMTKPEAFTPHANLVRTGVKCVFNPSSTRKIYQPRLTLGMYNMVNGYDIGLKVEFSAPKILLDNNLDELREADAYNVAEMLLEMLHYVGIDVRHKVLMNAEIVKIHYGKNFILDIPAPFVIRKLEKLDITKRIGNIKSSYINAGEQISYRTKRYELTFYDKVKEIEKDKIKCVPPNLDILRMEVRLNTKGEINKALRSIGITLDYICFKNLFSKEIAKQVLLDWFDRYVAPSENLLFLMEEDVNLLLHRVKCAGFTDSKAMQIIGFLKMLESSSSTTIKSHFNPKGSYYSRLKKDIAKIERKEGLVYRAFTAIRRDLEAMECLKILTKSEG